MIWMDSREEWNREEIDRRNESEKCCMQVRVLVRSTRTNERRCSAGVDANQAQSADVGMYPREKEGGVKKMRVKQMGYRKQRRISKR